MQKNRLEAFSDGVFAIVITLLVLEIKLPHVELSGLNEALLHLAPKFFSFALSFVIIGVYWISHHNMLHFIERTDRASLWLNILVLFTVCIIPFPTALIGDYPQAVTPVIFYACTLAAVNLAGTLFWVYSTHRGRLSVPGLRPGFARTVIVLHASPVLFYLAAIAFAFVWLPISYGIFVAVPLFFIVPNALLRRLFAQPMAA